jgi:translation elongation factor EF-G
VLENNNVSMKEFNAALINGFDLATMNGPLMDEPMQGAIFIIEDIQFYENSD